MEVATATPAVAAPSAGASPVTPTPASSHQPDSVDVYSGMADKLFSEGADELSLPKETPVAEESTTTAPAPAVEAQPQAQAQEQKTAPADPAKAQEPQDDAAWRDEDLPADILANLKRIHPDARKTLRSAYFRDQAMAATGMTVEHATRLKEMGFTPERAIATIKLLPTMDDTIAAVQAAEQRDQMIGDYVSAPEAFLSNLHNLNPAAHDKMVRAIGQRLPELAPDVAQAHLSDGLWNILGGLMKRGEATGNNDLKIAAEIIKEIAFPDSGSVEANGAVPNNLPLDIAREIAEGRQFRRSVQEREQQIAARQHAAFTDAVASAANKLVLDEIRGYIMSKNPSALSEAGIEKIVQEVASDVEQMFSGNRRLVDGLRAMVARGDLSREHFNAAVSFVTSRTKDWIPVATAPRLTFYTQQLFRNSTQQAAPKAPIRPTGGVTPPASSQPRPQAAAQGSGPMKGEDYYLGMERILGI